MTNLRSGFPPLSVYLWRARQPGQRFPKGRGTLKTA